MCPRCRQNAPIVYRGVAAYCTACGAPRMPLASSSVTLAGQPSKVGGTVARVFGWIVLGVGLSLALLFGIGLFVLFPEGLAWLFASAPIAALSTVFSWLLLRSGRGLQEIGAGEQKGARARAIFAMAQNRGGMLTALDAAHALDIRVEDADALLTEMAKTTPDVVSLEVDSNGGIYFRFPQLLTAWQGPGVRVEAGPPPPVRARVEDREPEVLEAEVIPPPRAAKRV
jgi:hypothetical protein